MLPKLTKTGKPVLLDFYTTWCITCRAQQRVISKLLSNESEFSDVIWVKIDWDQYSGSDLSKKLRIPRRSVLVMLKNGKETSRLVAQTDTKSIRKLIQSGLN
jgi:thiol:disulfide interchange protein